MSHETHEHGCGCGCHDENMNLYEDLVPVLEHYAGVPGSLITVLQKAQEIYGFLSTDLMRYIAIETDISIAKVYGVATFYTQFRFEPIGKYLVMLCQGTACHVNGSERVEEVVMETLNIKEGETTADGLFTLNIVACLGCCSLSPVMMVNDTTYGQLTPDKVKNILAEIKEKNLSQEATT